MRRFKPTKRAEKFITSKLALWFWIGAFGLSVSTSILGQTENQNTSSKTVVSLVYETKANPPFYFSKDQKHPKNLPGVSIELFNLVGQNIGIEFKFTRRPWARGLEELKENRFDGIFNASFKEERKQYGVFPLKNDRPDPSRLTIEQSYVFYKRKATPISWDGEKLLNFNGVIGTIIGYSINKDLKALGLSVDPVATQHMNLKKLALERIDLAADIDTMNDGFIAQDKELANIVKLSPPIKTKAYYLVFSHAFYESRPKLANKIWDEIAKIRQTKQLDQILRKYY